MGDDFPQLSWDLNFEIPHLLLAMLDNAYFFYANIGVDILRIDSLHIYLEEVGTTGNLSHVYD